MAYHNARWTGATRSSEEPRATTSSRRTPSGRTPPTAATLYSVEFFRECARRLKPGGVTCTWSPTRRVQASFRAAFPPRGHYGPGVLPPGSNEPITIDPDAWRTRLLAPEVAAYLAPERARSVLNLLVKMRQFEDADPAPDEEMNHDLFPRDEFMPP